MIRIRIPVLLVLAPLALLPEPARAAQDVREPYQRAVSLHRAGDLEAAVAAYREVLAIDGDNAAARSNLGAALAALGRYEEAIAAYRAALQGVPNPGIRYNLALAYYKSGDVTRAAEELEVLHEATPEELRTTLLLADCRFRLGQLDDVEALLRPVAVASPDNRAVLYLLSMALAQNGKVEESQPLVDRLLERGDSAETHFVLGSVAFSAGNMPEALQQLSRALELNPTLPSLRSYYGRALLFTGDADAAREAFEQSLADDPNDYDAHYYLASILATRGVAEEARLHGERARQLRPQSEEVRSLLASLDDPGGLEAGGDASPLLGRPMPDVGLLRLDGTPYRLSSLRGRPLLLVFGSLSCPLFRASAPDLNALYERYGDRVAFRMVYIREAHPAGESWESTINRREGVSLPAARTEEERAEHAATCRGRLDIPYDIALDTMAGTAEELFQAFPSRAFVVDREGQVTFSMALGEQSRPDALEKALTLVAR
ncbi:MAG: tetratricopeptide repeat protein [Acidobacteria bacterium]|nr:tetratricopeptide repeat protein [Acidobacteriota bacterium]